MNRLLDSFKVSKTHSSTAFYGFVVILIVFVLAVIFAIYLFLQSATFKGIETQFGRQTLNTTLYIICGAVVFMILLMLFNSQFEVYFQKRKSIGIDRPLPSHTVFWSPGETQNPQDPHNLTVTNNQFKMNTPETYALAIEVMISDTRTNDKFGPYRHLLHRGTDDLKTFVPNSPGSQSKGAGDLNDGLPSQMNPGIFVDQFSNDLIIFVDTDPTDGESRSQAYRESVRISDLPLNKPFVLHVTVSDRLLEVYINCRLAATKLLHGAPRGVHNEWFGRIGFARARAVIQNLKLWNDKLWAIEVRKVCTPVSIASNMAPTSAPVCGAN
jgi:hypothetical protein